MTLLRTTLGIASLCLFTASSVNYPILANPISDSLIVQNKENHSEKLTKENIQMVLDMIEKAREQKNVEGVLKYIAPFAYTTVTTEIDDDMLVLTLQGKAEHKDFLTKTYNEIENRQIIDKQVDIRVSPDGQMGIVVIREEKEYTIDNGDSFIAESVDTLRFGMIDGQPMVVSATLKGWLSPTPVFSEK